MSFFNPDIQSPTGSPHSMIDIMIGPLLLVFFGLMLFIGSIRYEMTYDKVAKWWKWSFLPLGLALVLGIQRFTFIFSLFYAQTINSKKELIAHWMGWILPLLSIVGVLVYNHMRNRADSRRVY